MDAVLGVLEALADPAAPIDDEALADQLLGTPAAMLVALAVAADALDLMEAAGVPDNDTLFGSMFSNLAAALGPVADPAREASLNQEAMTRLLRLVRCVRFDLEAVETVPTSSPLGVVGVMLIALQAISAPLADPDGVAAAVAAFIARNRPHPHRPVPSTTPMIRFGPDVDLDAALHGITEPRAAGRNNPCWCGSGRKSKHCHGSWSQAELGWIATVIWCAGTLPVSNLGFIAASPGPTGGGMGEPRNLEDLEMAVPVMVVDDRPEPAFRETLRRLALETIDIAPTSFTDTAPDIGVDTAINMRAAGGAARIDITWSDPVAFHLAVLIPFNAETFSWFAHLHRYGGFLVMDAAAGPEAEPTLAELASGDSVGVTVPADISARVLAAAADWLQVA